MVSAALTLPSLPAWPSRLQGVVHGVGENLEPRPPLYPNRLFRSSLLGSAHLHRRRFEHTATAASSPKGARPTAGSHMRYAAPQTARGT